MRKILKCKEILKSQDRKSRFSKTASEASRNSGTLNIESMHQNSALVFSSLRSHRARITLTTFYFLLAFLVMYKNTVSKVELSKLSPLFMVHLTAVFCVEANYQAGCLVSKLCKNSLYRVSYSQVAILEHISIVTSFVYNNSQ